MSIKPPKNDVLPLFLNDNMTDKPLLVVVYDGFLGFDLKDPSMGVNWFKHNKLPQVPRRKHVQASSMMTFLKKASEAFEVIIIMPKKNDFYKKITEQLVKGLGPSLSAVFYIRV